MQINNMFSMANDTSLDYEDLVSHNIKKKQNYMF